MAKKSMLMRQRHREAAVKRYAAKRAQLKELIAELSARNVSIMGIEGGRPSISGPGMPPILKGGRPAADFEVSEAEPVVEPAGQTRRDASAVSCGGRRQRRSL